VIKWLQYGETFKASEVEYAVVLRPYLMRFLIKNYQEDRFDMGVFSMGVQSYVDCIVGAIQDKAREIMGNPTATLFKQKYYRHNATMIDDYGSTSKDLSVVRGPYKLSQIMLVDNVSANFASNAYNCAPIRPFTLQTMFHREFGVDDAGNHVYTFDLGLVRLDAFLKHLNLDKTITEQNVFVFRK
jgi:hypothetical protein